MQSINIQCISHPWSTVHDLSIADPTGNWLLAGGLMVQVHAILGGLPIRPTQDADLLMDLISQPNEANRVRHLLSSFGFTIHPGTLTGYTTRMVSVNGSIVDVLVADHLPNHLAKESTYSGFPILPMPGGAQAIERSMTVEIDSGTDRFPLRVPDLLGATMLKSAAWETDKARDRSRHLSDAALLLSLMREPQIELARLHSKTDRKRIRTLTQHLGRDAEAWDFLNLDHRRYGLRALQILAQY